MNAVSVILRPARLADIPLLRQWDSEPHIEEAMGREPAEPGDWDWDTEIAQDVPWRQMLIAELDGRPIGFIEIIDPHEEETRYWGDCSPGLRALDIWIGDPACLGKGYGRRMMRLALERCFAAPDVKAVLIDPLARNERAIRFYRRIGFQPVERRMFDVDDCLVMRFDRAAFQPIRQPLPGEG